MNDSVTIEKVDNGYVVRAYSKWAIKYERVYKNFDELLEYLRMFFDEEKIKVKS